jgi:hypothetical protein
VGERAYRYLFPGVLGRALGRGLESHCDFCRIDADAKKPAGAGFKWCLFL